MKKGKYSFTLLLSLVIVAFTFSVSPVKAQFENADSTIMEVSMPVDNSIPDVPDELIQDRLNCLQKDVKLTWNSKIRGFIDYFTVKNRKYTLVMERRKNLYFPIFEAALKRHGMPDEIKYLAIVESGLNPKAISRAGAAGLWQFMPATGRMFGLQADAYVDDRMDPYKSTDAACQYLKQLYSMFGDWQLALASYNCGPGYVRRAIKRSGYKDTFWEIYNFLPAETRGYVPQFIAVTYAMNHMADHNIFADSLEYPMDFDTIQVKQYLNLDVLCEEMNICIEDVQKLNPSMKRPYLPENYSYVLRIPADKTSYLAMNRMAILDAATKKSDHEEKYNSLPVTTASSSGTQKQKLVYVVKSGDVLGKIAARHGVTVSQIKSWNKMKSTTIQKGQKLVIYKTVSSTYRADSGVQKPVAVKASPSVTKSNTTTAKNTSSVKPSTTKVKKPQIHYVKPGDTLWTISRKYSGVTVEQIKKLNNLKGNEIKAGQKLIIG